MNKIFTKIKIPKKKSFKEMQNFFKIRNIHTEKNYKFNSRESVNLNNKIYGPEI